MNVRTHHVAAASSGFTLQWFPRWLVGWWAAGRLVVLMTALAIHPSAWTLDRWDGHWYRIVARSGYLLVPGRQSDPAFFPLYPILVRGIHTLGVGWGLAGPLLSNLVFLPALGVFNALGRELFDESLARRATTYLALFPLGYVFSMAYPESVVLFLAAAAALSALRGGWWLAAALATAAALARPEAALLVLPLARIAWQKRCGLGSAERGLALAAVVAPFVGLLAYVLYLDTVLRDPLAWSRAEHAWGRTFRPTGPFWAVVHLPTQGPWVARDAALALVYAGLLYAAWRCGTSRAWLAAAVGILALPIFSGTFESVGRFGLLVPPIFWGLAASTKTPRAERAVQAASLTLLALGTLSIAYLPP